jgi:hypothetical protein
MKFISQTKSSKINKALGAHHVNNDPGKGFKGEWRRSVLSLLLGESY